MPTSQRSAGPGACCTAGCRSPFRTAAAATPTREGRPVRERVSAAGAGRDGGSRGSTGPIRATTNVCDCVSRLLDVARASLARTSCRGWSLSGRGDDRDRDLHRRRRRPAEQRSSAATARSSTTRARAVVDRRPHRVDDGRDGDGLLPGCAAVTRRISTKRPPTAVPPIHRGVRAA